MAQSKSQPPGELIIDIPRQFQKLVLSKKRIKIAYGGRGGSKTWSFATIFICKSLEKKIRIFCAREIMESIEQSVYATLTKRIFDMGLSKYFDIQKRKIIALNTGSEFFFGGLFRNIEAKKGLEDVNYVWISEADKVSEDSLQILLPSIRASDSEIWAEFNPGFDDDPIYKRYVAQLNDDAEIININWNDNPFINETLLRQKDSDYKLIPHEAPHIWEGKLKTYGAHIWCPPFTDVHVREFKWHTLTASNVNVVMAMDPHQHYYPACIWMALIKTNSGSIYKWVFAEYPTFGDFGEYYAEIRKKIQFLGNLGDLSAKFRDIEEKLPVKVLKRFMDSRFAKGVGSAGMWSKTDGILEQFRRVENGGLTFYTPREGIIDSQRAVIKSCMAYNTSIPMSELNEPTFFVSPSCKNVIQSLRNHRLQEDSEVEDEKYKDFSDSLRIAFAGVDRWVWQDEIKPEYYRGFPKSGDMASNWQNL